MCLCACVCVCVFSLRYVPDARREVAEAEQDMTQIVGEEGADFVIVDPASEPTASDPSDPVGTVRANLQALSVPRGGSVVAQWTVSGVLLVLQFAAKLKPGVLLTNALADAARI